MAEVKCVTEWITFCFLPQVPDDVFAPDFVWKGSYDYRGHKQPMTLTVSSFNATTGKVNVTLFDSSVEFQLSGESSLNHLPHPPNPHHHHHHHMSLPFISGAARVNQSISERSHAWQWKLTVGLKGGCAGSHWLAANSSLKTQPSSLLTSQIPPT